MKEAIESKEPLRLRRRRVRSVPMKLLPLLTLCALFLTGSHVAQAQVEATLVAESTSIEPGKPFTAALRLVHKPHWHSYWVYPGTGLPTTLAFTLPPGWTATDILWPTPNLLSDTRGTVIGNGYDGDLLLPVTLTPPANLKPGTSVTLNAKSDWLMCLESCVPGNADVSLTLAVADHAVPDPMFSPRLKAVMADLPKAPMSFTMTATRDAKNVTLTLTGTGAGALANVHFFSQDGYVAFDLAEPTEKHGNTLVITLPIGPDAPSPAPARLTGVLAAGIGPERKGYTIDLPFAASAAETTPIDTIHADFRDSDGLERDCRRSRRDGFLGRMAIHPDTVAIAQTSGLSDSVEGFAVRKGEPSLVNFLNAWIVYWRADGWLADTHRDWFDSLDWVKRLSQP